MTKRYRLICVAPEVPDLGSYDSLDQAIANSTPNYEVYDTVWKRYVEVGPEDFKEARARLASLSQEGDQ